MFLSRSLAAAPTNRQTPLSFPLPLTKFSFGWANDTEQWTRGSGEGAGGGRGTAAGGGGLEDEGRGTHFDTPARDGEVSNTHTPLHTRHAREGESELHTTRTPHSRER